MSNERPKSSDYMLKHREGRRAQGFAETTVWVHEDTRQIVERLIREGKFKNRKAALNHAIERYFAETEPETMGH